MEGEYKYEYVNRLKNERDKQKRFWSTANKTPGKVASATVGGGIGALLGGPLGAAIGAAAAGAIHSAVAGGGAAANENRVNTIKKEYGVEYRGDQSTPQESRQESDYVVTGETRKKKKKTEDLVEQLREKLKEDEDTSSGSDTKPTTEDTSDNS